MFTASPGEAYNAAEQLRNLLQTEALGGLALGSLEDEEPSLAPTMLGTDGCLYQLVVENTLFLAYSLVILVHSYLWLITELVMHQIGIVTILLLWHFIRQRLRIRSRIFRHVAQCKPRTTAINPTY